MSESAWREAGQTLSNRTACKEYGLTNDQIIEAVHKGKLQYRINYAHGNPYYRLLRKEVEALAKKLLGKKGANSKKIEQKIASINKELRSLKRKMASLEKEKLLLEKQR